MNPKVIRLEADADGLPLRIEQVQGIAAAVIAQGADVVTIRCEVMFTRKELMDGLPLQVDA